MDYTLYNKNQLISYSIYLWDVKLRLASFREQATDKAFRNYKLLIYCAFIFAYLLSIFSLFH
jgi:hypothetical protein